MKANYNTIEKETEKAIFVSFTCGRQGWLPKSICTVCEADKTIELPDWKARDLRIDDKSIARSKRENAALERSIAQGWARMTDAEKAEADKNTKLHEIYCHYDRRRDEWYAIGTNGKRYYA